MKNSDKRILVHVCCGPCSLYPVTLLKKQGYEPELLFYNPNLYPEDEVVRRLDAARQAAAHLEVRLIEMPEDESVFIQAIRGLENEPERGLRCAECFRLRLDETARQAEKRGFGIFTTVLTVSAHKDEKQVFRAGRDAGARHKVTFLEMNFKKNHGAITTAAMAREAGLYMQNYCGCRYSLADSRRRKKRDD